MLLLEVKNLFKTFDSKLLSAVNRISFSMKEGEYVSMIGPSGTGKSTTAKMICGRLKLGEGEVYLNGELLVSESVSNTKLLKKVSYVPQELSLDGDKTIFENIAEPIKDESENYIHHHVRDMIEVFGLQYKDHKYPHEISTGQKQRVEMAKALVNKPDLVILDEPFSNLDQPLRGQLKDELLEILDGTKTAILSVTHDLEDAFSGSDRILLLANGEVQQFSAPEDIYEKPANAFVAKFTGPVNLIASKVLKSSSGKLYVKNSFGEVIVENSCEDLASREFLYVAIRPEHCRVHPKGRQAAKVQRVRYFGAYKHLWLKTKDQNKFIIKVATSEKYINGQKIRFDWQDESLYLLPI